MKLSDTPVVATVLEAVDRARLDAAAEGCFAALHTGTVREALRTVRERPIHAVLVSPSCVPREHLAGIARLVKSFPAVPTVAVVSRHDGQSSERLLDFGATGVQRFVDLSARDGWRDRRAHV